MWNKKLDKDCHLWNYSPLVRWSKGSIFYTHVTYVHALRIGVGILNWGN